MILVDWLLGSVKTLYICRVISVASEEECGLIGARLDKARIGIA